MSDQELLARIHTTPEILEGKPAVRGTRLSVAFILNLLAHGASVEEILAEYEGLEREVILACLLFAARALEGSPTMSPSILDLFGGIDYDPDYDYKKQRAKR